MGSSAPGDPLDISVLGQLFLPIKFSGKLPAGYAGASRLTRYCNGILWKSVMFLEPLGLAQNWVFWGLQLENQKS